MPLIFTGTYDELKEKLSSISGNWDENQANKKVLQFEGGVMNWFESTGTIQFQGKDKPKAKLENMVLSCLNPNHQTQVTDETVPEEGSGDVQERAKHITQEDEGIGIAYLNGRFKNSEIIIGLVSAVGTETTRVITPLKDRLTHFGYNVK